jgi:hypothetical protein
MERVGERARNGAVRLPSEDFGQQCHTITSVFTTTPTSRPTECCSAWGLARGRRADGIPGARQCKVCICTYSLIIFSLTDWHEAPASSLAPNTPCCPFVLPTIPCPPRRGSQHATLADTKSFASRSALGRVESTLTPSAPLPQNFPLLWSAPLPPYPGRDN